jgi:YidC/Oxa1 family membrane protein insertase
MQNRDEMHPQDRRNLIIFAVLSISMWLAYDYFIARPQAEAARVAALKARAVAEATAPAEILDTAVVKPRKDMIAASPRVKIDTPAITGSINLQGARLDDVQLKDYFTTVEKKQNVHVLSPARTPFPRYIETGWIAGEEASISLPDAQTRWTLKEGTTLTPETPVTIAATIDGVTFEKTYTVDKDFAFTIESRVINNSGKALKLYPYTLATEHGLPEEFMNQGVVHEGPIGYIGEDLHEIDYKDFKKKPDQTFAGSAGWVGITSKYWLTAIAPVDQNDATKFRFVSSPKINEATKDRFQADFIGSAKEIPSGQTVSYKINAFAGAKKIDLLEAYEKSWGVPHFDLAVDFGWFYFLTKPFFHALNFLYKLTGNFGIAIILFTCVLRVFVFPLANTSYRSFAKLRMVAPEMYTLRHEYKDNKQKLQEELVKLYQKHNVNPAAGCLPILVQIPIFFALYKVLSNTIEMRHAPFFGWIQDLSAKDPTSLFNLFGLLPYDVPSFLMIGAWPVMMVLGMIVQKNISPPPDDPIQARLIAIMPYFMGYIMAGFASGLVIYWTFNNVLAIIQQVIIMKSMGVPIHLFSKDKVKEKLEEEIKDGPMVEPSLAMIEDKIEGAIEGEETKPVSAPKPKKKKKK